MKITTSFEEKVNKKTEENTDKYNLTVLLSKLRRKAGQVLGAEKNIYAMKEKESVINEIIQEAFEKIRRSDNIEPMTGLFERDYMVEVAANKMMESGDSGDKLVFDLADIDFFKVYNEVFGHYVGDMEIQMVADKIKELGSAGRMGGEEMCAVSIVSGRESFGKTEKTGQEIINNNHELLEKATTEQGEKNFELKKNIVLAFTRPADFDKEITNKKEEFEKILNKYGLRFLLKEDKSYADIFLELVEKKYNSEKSQGEKSLDYYNSLLEKKEYHQWAGKALDEIKDLIKIGSVTFGHLEIDMSGVSQLSEDDQEYIYQIVNSDDPFLKKEVFNSIFEENIDDGRLQNISYQEIKSKINNFIKEKKSDSEEEIDWHTQNRLKMFLLDIYKRRVGRAFDMVFDLEEEQKAKKRGEVAHQEIKISDLDNVLDERSFQGIKKEYLTQVREKYQKLRKELRQAKEARHRNNNFDKRFKVFEKWLTKCNAVLKKDDQEFKIDKYTVKGNVNILLNKLQMDRYAENLVGVYNRRYLFDVAQSKVEQCLEAGKPAHFLMLDFDNLKAVNEAAGHSIGDIVLMIYAQKMNNFFDQFNGQTGDLKIDFIKVTGGEEFGAVIYGEMGDDFLNDLEKVQDEARQEVVNFLQSTDSNIEDCKTLYDAVKNYLDEEENFIGTTTSAIKEIKKEEVSVGKKGKEKVGVNMGYEREVVNDYLDQKKKENGRGQLHKMD